MTVNFYKFMAQWCTDCRLLGLHGATAVDIDTPEGGTMCTKYGIAEIPTYVIEKITPSYTECVRLENPESDSEIEEWKEKNGLVTGD